MGHKIRSVMVISLKNKLGVADRCSVAVSFIDRLRGLIGTKVLEKGQGLLLSPCNDIHMWMMSIPIDVVFLAKAVSHSEEHPCGTYRVTSVRKNLRPWRAFPVRDSKASVTLELPIGTIEQCKIHEGDEICIS